MFENADYVVSRFLFREIMDLHSSLANVSAAVWLRVCYVLHKFLVRYLEKAERDCM